MGGGSNPAPPPTGYRRAIARSAVQKTAGAQSAAPAGAFRSATAAGGTWRGDRMFLPRPQLPQILTQNLATPHQKEGQPC